MSAVQSRASPSPTAGAGADAARAAINEQNARGMTAFNSRDVASYAALYDDGATLMNLAGPDFVGRPAIDSGVAADWRDPGTAGIVGTWKADSVEVHGDYAYEVGRGVFIRPAAAAGAAPDTLRNRYITYWRKGTDGRWRITRDFAAFMRRPTK